MEATAWILAGILAGVDPALLSGLCYVESKHQQQAYVANDGGSPSIGICQIKLASARQMGFTGTEAELQEPKTNALYAAKYLKWQHKRYGDWTKAISAYNCGRACGNKSYVKKVKEAAWGKIRPVNAEQRANYVLFKPSVFSTVKLVRWK